jgi:hypothetical protein
MSELTAMKAAAHRNNIERYRRLLRTQLTDHERRWLQARLAEEKAELQRLGCGHTIAAKTRPSVRARKPYSSIPPHIAAAANRLRENSGGGPFHSG